MTDEAYTFVETSKERKALARQAKYKKNGSKSKKCTLRQDTMTKKELMAMNGPVISYDMKKVYTFEEFKKMPKDIQIGYINRFINVYNCNLADITSVVFGISYNTLYNHLCNHKIKEFINLNKAQARKKTDRSIIDRMRIDLGLAAKTESKPMDDVVPKLSDGPSTTVLREHDVPVMKPLREHDIFNNVATTSPADPIVEPESKTKLTGGSFHMNGFDISLLKTLSTMFDENCSVTITVTTRPGHTTWKEQEVSTNA